jgi:hypothetical protein
MNVQPSGALCEDASPMTFENVFDRVEASAAALRYDALENEEIPIARTGLAHERSLPRPCSLVAIRLVGQRSGPSAQDLRSEIFMPLHELRMSHENKLDELAAFLARRELLARDARHVVRFAMFPVVKSGIDSGLPYLVARLEHVDTLFGSHTVRPKDMRVKLSPSPGRRQC